MNHTPTFGSLPTEAWLQSITYPAKRLLLLMLAGGIGQLIGTVASLTTVSASWVGLGVIAYPFVLLTNALLPLGVVIWLVFAAFLIGVTVFDLNLRHAFGWLLPLQALFTFEQLHPEGLTPWLVLITLLSPFVLFYLLLLLDYVRDEYLGTADA